MAARTSRDIDVWKPASYYDLIELKNKYRPALAAVRSVAETFQNPGRRQALENLVFLELADDGEATR